MPRSFRVHIMLFSTLLAFGCSSNDGNSESRQIDQFEKDAATSSNPISGDELIHAVVMGRVVSAEPIEGAEIYMLGSGPHFYEDLERKSTTDSSGRFEFETEIGGYSYATQSEFKSGDYFVGLSAFYLGAKKQGYTPQAVLWDPGIWIPGGCATTGVKIRFHDIVLSATG